MFMLQLAEHGSALSTVCGISALYRKFLYPGRLYLPKSKDFNYTGQLGLCYFKKCGTGSTRHNRHLTETLRISTFKILFVISSAA